MPRGTAGAGKLGGVADATFGGQARYLSGYIAELWLLVGVEDAVKPLGELVECWRFPLLSLASSGQSWL